MERADTERPENDELKERLIQIEGFLVTQKQKIEELVKENCELKMEIQQFKALYAEKMKAHDYELEELKLAITHLQKWRSNVQLRDLCNDFILYVMEEVIDFMPLTPNKKNKRKRVNYWRNLRSPQTTRFVIVQLKFLLGFKNNFHSFICPTDMGHFWLIW